MVTARPKELSKDRIDRWMVTHPKLKDLVERTKTMVRGDELDATTAWSLCGGKDEFAKISAKWKAIVLDRDGITIVYNAANKSYRWLTADEHLVDYNTKQQLSLERKARMNGARLGVIRDDDFDSDHQRSLRNLLMQQHFDTAGKIESQREHARIACERPETLPRLAK